MATYRFNHSLKSTSYVHYIIVQSIKVRTLQQRQQCLIDNNYSCVSAPSPMTSTPAVESTFLTEAVSSLDTPRFMRHHAKLLGSLWVPAELSISDPTDPTRNIGPSTPTETWSPESKGWGHKDKQKQLLYNYYMDHVFFLLLLFSFQQEVISCIYMYTSFLWKFAIKSEERGHILL